MASMPVATAGTTALLKETEKATVWSDNLYVVLTPVSVLVTSKDCHLWGCTKSDTTEVT